MLGNNSFGVKHGLDDDWWKTFEGFSLMTVHCVRGGRLAGETSQWQAGAYFGCGSTLAGQVSDWGKAPGAGDNSFPVPQAAR